MKFDLVERRTNDSLVPAGEMSEHDCVNCRAHGSVMPSGPLVQNVNDQKDMHGFTMVEQQVHCRRCETRWVDVFKRAYPSAIVRDAQSDGSRVNL